MNVLVCDPLEPSCFWIPTVRNEGRKEESEGKKKPRKRLAMSVSPPLSVSFWNAPAFLSKDPPSGRSSGGFHTSGQCTRVGLWWVKSVLFFCKVGKGLLEECAFLLQRRKRIIGGKKESLRHDFSRFISGKRTCGSWRFGSWFPKALPSPGKPSERLHALGQMSLHPSLKTTELLQLIYCNLPQFILIVSGRDQNNLWVLNSAPLYPSLPQPSVATGYWNWGGWIETLSPQELTKLSRLLLFFFVNSTWLTNLFCFTKHKCPGFVFLILSEKHCLCSYNPAEKEGNTTSHFYAILATEQQCGAKASFATQESFMFGTRRGWTNR